MTDAEIIAIVQNYLNTLATVRVPELPPYSTTGGALSLGDKIPVYNILTNKTVRTTLQDLKDLMISADGSVLTPDQIGSSIVVIAGTAEVGTNIFNIPSLAGKEFLLRKVGFGTLKFDDPNKQYEMLSSGGFRLLLGAIIQENDQFEVQLVNDSFIQLTTASRKLFKGSVLVSSSVTLNAVNHLGKLIQLRPAAAGVAVTLPDVNTVEEDTIVAFESMINCPHEVKINTTGGQYIYFNGTSQLDVFLRKAEWIWLYRGTDGWYVLFGAPGITQVGLPIDGYDIGINEVELAGQQISITAYPRFWKWISSLPYSVVDEATWAIAAVYFKDGIWYTTAPAAPYETLLKPYRGCFAHDTASDLVRLPDFSDQFTRTLGTDNAERYHNHPGGYQGDKIRSHTHEIEYEMNGTDGIANGQHLRIDAGPPTEGLPTGLNTYAIKSYGGSETRGQGIGLLKKIKV